LIQKRALCCTESARERNLGRSRTRTQTENALVAEYRTLARNPRRDRAFNWDVFLPQITHFPNALA